MENPFLATTIGIKSFKEFLSQAIFVSNDTISFLGFENNTVELPTLIFTDYNYHKVVVINLMDLSFFEIIKYIDVLVIEDKGFDVYVLRGKMPEDFYHDRAILERWQDYIEAKEQRQRERRTTGWLPDAEIGR